MPQFSTPLLQRLSDYCMSKPGAGNSGANFDVQYYRFEWGFGFERTFAHFNLDATPARLNLSASPETAQPAAARYVAVNQINAPWTINGHAVIEIVLDESVPDDEIERWIDESFDLLLNDLTQHEQKVAAIAASQDSVEDKLNALTEIYGLVHRQSEIIGLLRNAVAIQTRPSEPIAVGQSCLGGLPDLPEGVGWPSYDGKPLAFIGQFNLSEIPDGVTIEGDLLPREGLLSFFTVFGWQEQDGDISRAIPWMRNDPDMTQVLYTRTVDTLRRLAPASENFRLFRASPVVFSNIPSLPNADSWNRDPVLYDCSWSDEELERLSYLELNFDSVISSSSPMHQLLGYAQPVQEAVTSRETELLFELTDNEHNTDFEFYACLYFVAPRADLLRRNYSSVVGTYQTD